MPVHFDERLPEQELPVGAVEHVHHAVAIGPEHRFARPALELDVGEHRNLRRVVVELVVRRELEMPLELTGVGVERDDRFAVEVVAGAAIAVPVGTRIADAPVGQIEIGIVGAGHPDRAAAGLPRIAGPRLVSALARTGNGVEAPGLLAGAGVERGDKPADAEFAADGADDDLVLDDQRSQGEAVAGFRPRAADGDVPHQPAGLRVDGQEMTVERAHEDRVAENRDAAIHAAAAGAGQRRRAIRVGPEDASGRRIERHEIVRRLDRVHDAVHHQRRRLELLERLRLEDPSELEILHVGGRDLGQRAVALAHHVARIRQPVLRLRRTTKDAVEGDLRAESYRQPRDHRNHKGHEDHKDRGIPDARYPSFVYLCALWFRSLWLCSCGSFIDGLSATRDS